ncbi:MAG: tRNA pseudouridine(55) synthase TruB [Cyanophyceae cyanobacterium]
MFGFLNLNKPAGMTSHDCVARLRRLLRIKRIGHGGTLDPAAVGVLPIAVGKATRLLQFLPDEKAYWGRIRFGVQTTTDDLEGEVIATASAAELEKNQVAPVLQQFEGQIEQVPPAYSAIQREGQRLYELARRGETVEVPTRTVWVKRMEMLHWYPGEFPELEVAIACGSGTYIRAIARDVGAALGVGGTLAALKRTASGGFQLEESLSFEQIEGQLQQGTFSLIPPPIALSHLPVVQLAPPEARRWCQGQKLAITATKITGNIVRVQQEGQFLGIAQRLESLPHEVLVPKIVVS